jgi:hypothetical protein
MRGQAIVTPLFPSVVYHRDEPKIITNEIKKLSKELCFEYGNQPFITKCLSTVDTYNRVLDLPEFSTIREYVVQGITDYVGFMSFDRTIRYELNGSWLNYYEPGNLQEPHIHHDSMMSGVLYITGSKQEDFYFRSSNYYMQSSLPYLEESTEYNRNDAKYQSLDGRLIIFMSGLLHGTLPVGKERISLSFNVISHK